jgi:hypothetical protein
MIGEQNILKISWEKKQYSLPQTPFIIASFSFGLYWGLNPDPQVC